MATEQSDPARSGPARSDPRQSDPLQPASDVSDDILTRPAPPPDFTVAYGDHPDQIADVRLPPEGPEVQPIIIFIHGGFWKPTYDRAHAGPLASDLAARGYIVANLEYRRMGVGGGGWRGTFDDVADGVTELPGLIAQTLGLADADDGGVIVMGHSAGGHLALWVASHVEGIRGVVALAPVADLARAYTLGLGGGAVGQLLGGGPGEVPDRYLSADPMANLPTGVPTVVVHGALDLQVPVEISRDFVAAAKAAEDPTSLVELADIDHFAVIDPLSPAWPAVLSGLATVRAGGRG